jgi:GNAT superfamily N-acetyltransferase
LEWRYAQDADLPLLARWNRELQEDEGAAAMSAEALLGRLRRWLSSEYTAILFDSQETPIGYALFRRTDPDLKDPSGVYLRQFFVSRDKRRQGMGTRAMELLLADVLGGHRVILEALNSNPAGHAFWRSLGFQPYSVRYDLDPSRGP